MYKSINLFYKNRDNSFCGCVQYVHIFFRVLYTVSLQFFERLFWTNFYRTWSIKRKLRFEAACSIFEIAFLLVQRNRTFKVWLVEESYEQRLRLFLRAHQTFRDLFWLARGGCPRVWRASSKSAPSELKQFLSF